MNTVSIITKDMLSLPYLPKDACILTLKERVKFSCCICNRWNVDSACSFEGVNIHMGHTIEQDDVFYVIPEVEYHNPEGIHAKCKEIFELCPMTVE